MVTLYSWRFIVLLLVLAPAGQSGKKTSSAEVNTRQRVDRAKQLWNVDQMLEEHCDRLGMHYNLDAAQTEKTRELLVSRVTKFLDQHENELWPLMLELTEMQYSGEAPDRAAAKRIASKGYNVFLQAKAEILRAQDDFAKYLNEDQKKIHERDLKGLDYHFSTMDKQFQNWKRGKVSSKPLFANVRLAGGQKLLPERASMSESSHESLWDKYVEKFIREYQLDEEQKAKAVSILKDVKGSADKYRQANKKGLDEAEIYRNEACASKSLASKECQEAEMLFNMMKKSLDDLFVELKGRLDLIPTEQQKADYYKRYPNRKAADKKPRVTAKPKPQDNKAAAAKAPAAEATKKADQPAVETPDKPKEKTDTKPTDNSKKAKP